MTTLFLTDKTCYICGSNNKYPQIDLSLSITGTRDLDGRPSHIQRSLVYLWIQKCTSCGYCAPEISNGKQNYSEIINLPEYTSQLSSDSYPDTARAFLCYSILMNSAGQYADAGWATLCAAWICDDNRYTDAAIACRSKTLVFFQKARESNQDFAPSGNEEEIYLIDITRRIGNFDQAKKLCTEELKKNLTEKNSDLLTLELELIEKKDSSCHNESEIDEMD